MICDEPSSELLIQAMRIGVRDVLSWPVSPEVIKTAVARIEQKQHRLNHVNQKGKVLSFIACKGGSGSTFLATNLGYVLAAEFGKKVALIDMNLHLGDAALFVSDHPPAYTLADVASNIMRLDPSFLTSSMVPVLENYYVLASPERVERVSEIKPDHIEALMRLAVEMFDFVILDMDRAISTLSIRALDRTDLFFPIMQDTLPFIRDAKQLTTTLQSLGYQKGNFRFLLNRYDKGGDILLADVERALGMKMYRVIPNSYKAVSASVNQGIPVARIAPHDPVTKALLEMAGDLVGEPRAKEEGAQRREKGVLANLLGRFKA
jgi:pilus assembly protein CpaE